jgi:AcrR family transcriptional regulator
MPATSAAGSARERLLAAASELFYAEGIHTVGIDRVIERAGVAKASLYNTYGSKDGLIGAYLHERHMRSEKRIDTALDKLDTPREKLLGIFDAQRAFYLSSNWRGCAFMNASAESLPGSTVEQVSDEYRAWFRGLFTDLSREAGASDPEALAAKLVLLHDGTAMSARMDRNPDAFTDAKAIAAMLIDAATASAE